MKIKNNIIPFYLLIGLSIAQVDEEKVIDTYNFDIEDVKRIEVKIDYTMGKLTITDNGKLKYIDGTVEYFPKWISPDIRYHTIGTKGKLRVEIEAMDFNAEDEDRHFLRRGKDMWKGVQGKNGVSEVSLHLPRDIPIEMEMDFGLGEANIDLTTLSISDFILECGLGETTLELNSANPEQSKKVIINAGLGEFVGTGLGNLRGKVYEFNLGLGSSSIDLTGNFIEDMEGTIDVGLGSLHMVLPKKANIRLEIERSFLSSVNVEDLVQDDGVWSSPHWDRDLPTVEFEISVGLGSVYIHLGN